MSASVCENSHHDIVDKKVQLGELEGIYIYILYIYILIHMTVTEA